MLLKKQHNDMDVSWWVLVKELFFQLDCFGQHKDDAKFIFFPKPDGVSQRHTLHIASHFYMNEENEVSFHEFLSWTILYPLKK